jgi:hypothetical protein
MGPLPRDVYCGFKLWRGDVAQTVFEQVHLDGWAFDAEALALARRLGYSVREVGIEWTNREDSRLSIGNVLIPVTGELLAARRHVRRVAAQLTKVPGAGGPADPRSLSLADGHVDGHRDGLTP